MRKKGDGELELEVLRILWAADDALQPAEVQERLAEHLAYTSVATVDTTHGKGTRGASTNRSILRIQSNDIARRLERRTDAQTP
ncbi:MAG: hypothetical protein EBY07_13920 [Actinobacteria bacterium]|nr:hypothetical protein [Actinomycetota bacterium]